MHVNSFPLAPLKRRAAIPSQGSPRDRSRSQSQPAKARLPSNPVLSNLDRWIAERIGRAISTIEPDLMRPVPVGEGHPVVLCQFEATARASISHDLSTRHAVGIELVIPR